MLSKDRFQNRHLSPNLVYSLLLRRKGLGFGWFYVELNGQPNSIVFWYDQMVINEISIIIPTLNEANYLPSLLDSICTQSFVGKLQIIVVDGHSTDDTVKIARSFANRIPDLLVLKTKRDIGHQRNRGAQLAKYRYLLFLDADVILPSKLLRANPHLPVM